MGANRDGNPSTILFYGKIVAEDASTIEALLQNPNLTEAQRVALRKKLKSKALTTSDAPPDQDTTDQDASGGGGEAAYRHAIGKANLSAHQAETLQAAETAATTAAAYEMAPATSATAGNPAWALPAAFLIASQYLFGGPSKSDIPIAFHPEYAVGDKTLASEIPGYAKMSKDSQERIATTLQAMGKLETPSRGNADDNFALKGKVGVDTKYQFSELNGKTIDEYMKDSTNNHAVQPEYQALYDYIKAERQGLTGDKLQAAFEPLKPYLTDPNQYGGFGGGDKNPAQLYDDLSAIAPLDPDYADSVDRRNQALLWNFAAGQDEDTALSNVQSTGQQITKDKIASMAPSPQLMAMAGLPQNTTGLSPIFNSGPVYTAPNPAEPDKKTLDLTKPWTNTSAFLQLGQPNRDQAQQVQQNTGQLLSVDPATRKKQIQAAMLRDPTMRANAPAFMSMGAGLQG